MQREYERSIRLEFKRRIRFPSPCGRRCANDIVRAWIRTLRVLRAWGL
jgi:hypothetical protein